jgi:hypothetical protein
MDDSASPPPVDVLVEASRSAAMIRVGSGSTAADVARTAHSSVAVIRHRRANPFHTNLWIVGAPGQSPSSVAVPQTAVEEVRPREAPLLTITTSANAGENANSAADEQNRRAKPAQRLASAVPRGAGVEVCDHPMPNSLLDFLAHLARKLVGYKARRLLGKSKRSLFLVR